MIGVHQMNYLIRVGEFNNKGAKAMTLVAFNRILQTDKNANIFMLNNGNKAPFVFGNNIHLLDNSPYFIDLCVRSFSFNAILSLVKDFVKLFITKKISF